jgi:hypothetical protein
MFLNRLRVNSLKILLVVTVVLIGMLPVSCHKTPATSISPSGTSQGEGFAIYLTAQDVPVPQMESLSHVDLADKPLISVVDIVSYDWNTHKITLSETGKEKLKNFEVPISGKVFLVCIDKAPVYWGAFYNPLSSYFPFGKPVIYAFPMLWESFEITWEPVSGDGENPGDPRIDPNIFNSLKQWGKLTPGSVLNPTPPAPLVQSDLKILS